MPFQSQPRHTALFRLPYTREPVSIALHRCGETLVVDGALHELYEPPPAAPSVGSGAGGGQQQPPLQEKEEEEMGSGGGKTTSSSSSSSSSGTTSSSKCLTLAPASFRLPPGPLHLPPPPRDHSNHLHFRLRELSLLMGTDVQVFRNARHPGGVSALFYEEEEGLQLSHCLDSYLENVRLYLCVCVRVSCFCQEARGAGAGVCRV